MGMRSQYQGLLTVIPGTVTLRESSGRAGGLPIGLMSHPFAARVPWRARPGIARLTFAQVPGLAVGSGPAAAKTTQKPAEWARGQARAALASSRHDERDQKPILPHPRRVK